MAYILIAISLILLAVLGVAALLLTGRDSNSGLDLSPKERSMGKRRRACKKHP